MWRYQTLSDGGVTLELTTSTESKLPLTIDLAETVEEKLERLISENPVIIFSRSSCYMCHVIKKLLSSLGVHPTVIELEEDEISVLLAHDSESSPPPPPPPPPGGAIPVVFIGGARVGGFESLVGLHVTNNLVPKLSEAGALWR